MSEGSPAPAALPAGVRITYHIYLRSPSLKTRVKLALITGAEDPELERSVADSIRLCGEELGCTDLVPMTDEQIDQMEQQSLDEMSETVDAHIYDDEDEDDEDPDDELAMMPVKGSC